MKNEPTQLEIFLKERVKALELELKRVNDELIDVKVTLERTAIKIQVSNPDFLNPISDLEYEIIDPL